MGNKAAKRARLAVQQGGELPSGDKLWRYTHCIKPGIDGCVNTEGSVHENAGWMHWCPGCNQVHAIAVEHPFSNGAKWTFNGDLHRPTFSPSVKIKIGPMPTVPADRPDAGKVFICHYHIRSGVIEYCSDCTHSLSGQKVPLPLPPKDRYDSAL